MVHYIFLHNMYMSYNQLHCYIYVYLQFFWFRYTLAGNKGFFENVNTCTVIVIHKAPVLSMKMRDLKLLHR